MAYTRRVAMAASAVTNPFSLDPFTTIISLAILAVMPPGVKLGIRNNSIIFFQPTVFDIISRTFQSITNNGCTRDCLYRLRTPVRRAVEWYGYDSCPEVFNMAYKGLARLRETYKQNGGGNVTDTIEFCMQLLRPEGLEGTEPESLVGKPSLQRLQKAWSVEERKAVGDLFLLMTSNPDQAFYITCIHEIVKGKEPALHAIIREPAV
jgi:hypothetical protein